MLACNLVKGNRSVATNSENPIPTIIRIIDTIVSISIVCVEKKNV